MQNDWDLHPDKYCKDAAGAFIFKKDGTPRKKSGRAKGSTGKGYTCLLYTSPSPRDRG